MHVQQITAASRKILRPMGMVQKGRSRTWLDDRNWWLGVVEFQPSSWSKGTYLNVGCMWLWRVKDYISFDEGYRVESFVQFKDGQQFEGEAERIAIRASNEINKYRTIFYDIRATASYYISHPTNAFWPSYNAGIACALANRPEEARSFFHNVMQAPGNESWCREAQSEAEEFCKLSRNLKAIRQVVTTRVQKTRAIFKMPATEILFD